MENFEIEGRAQYLRVRCPQCFRIYSVNIKEIKEAKPRFECVSCKTRFWLAFPECLHQSEVVGFPIQWLNPPIEFVDEQKAETRPCPKCQAKVLLSARECQNCGVIFEKIKQLTQDEFGPQATRPLRDQWRQLLENFDQEDLHHKFREASQAEGHLTYALARYSLYLEVEPSDLLARKMRDSIRALLETKMELPKPVRRRPLLALWMLHGVLLFFGLILLVLGFLKPEYRNVVGFGAALIFLSLAMQIYFKR